MYPEVRGLDNGIVSDEYLAAYGAAVLATSNGETKVHVDDAISKSSRLGVTHAITDSGMGIKACIAEDTQFKDHLIEEIRKREIFLKAYGHAVHTLLSGSLEIDLGLKESWPIIERSAVVEACHDFDIPVEHVSIIHQTT